MRTEKSNITSYLSSFRKKKFSSKTNIQEIIKKNKESRRSEKKRTIYTAFGFIALFFIIGLYIFL